MLNTQITKIRSIFKLFNTIASEHPLTKKTPVKSLLRWAKYQIVMRLNKGNRILLKFIDNTWIVTSKEMTGTRANYYFGVTEFDDVFFILHTLRKDDVFFDVGANTGSLSILGKIVGCETHSFEPNPKTLRWLKTTMAINNFDDINIHEIGLGEVNSSIPYSDSGDGENHFYKDDSQSNNNDSILLPVKRLDDLDLPAPTLVKIDVEGFEWEVINGAAEVLAKDSTKVVLLEALSEEQNDPRIYEFMTKLGFKAYSYMADQRTLLAGTNGRTHNAIYCKDPEWVNNRVKDAEQHEIWGHHF